VYFHRRGAGVDEALGRYLDALASALRAFARRQGAKIAVVGMERIDRAACEALAARLGEPCPVFVSDEDGFQELVSLLRASSFVVASRYHAVVCSMTAGVPSVGVAMDERIRNLMAERGTPDLCLEAADPDLAGGLRRALDRLADDRARVVSSIVSCVRRNLERQAEMGRRFMLELTRLHPEFPLRRSLPLDAPWPRFLPPLPPHVRSLF
jgi:polysaccharide pyruvyl transferase WcaK-like protein